MIQSGEFPSNFKQLCNYMFGRLTILKVRARPIYQLAGIIGQYWVIANISVLAYASPISADIKTIFKARTNVWTSDLKWCNYVVLITNK